MKLLRVRSSKVREKLANFKCLGYFLAKFINGFGDVHRDVMMHVKQSQEGEMLIRHSRPDVGFNLL